MRNITQEDITLEASLLKAMAIKKNYDQFIGSLDTKRLIQTTANLLADYKKYYKKYNNDVDWQVFHTEFVHNWHAKDLDAKDLEYYRTTVFPLITNSVVSDSLYISLLERDASTKIQSALEKGMNEVYINDILSSLAREKAIFLNTVDEDVFNVLDLDLTVLDNNAGLPWFLPSLQAGLGSHMPGQFVLVSADSNTGKSAFCISQVVHIFKHINKNNIDRPILYCTSEDTKEDLACRFLSCLYRDKCPGGFEEIIQNYVKVKSSYEKHFNDTLFRGLSIRSPKDMFKIREKIDTYNPCVVIIDMLDILSNSDNIQDLTKCYQEIRGIANDGFPIIGTTQAGNTSYQYKDPQTQEISYRTRKWLTEKDTAGSKGGGKQGAAYSMIMIGKDDDVPNIRYLTTTKKKRGKNVNITCTIDESHSCYKELL